MTKAVMFDEYGPPEVLTMVELDDVDPGPGQLLVAVRAAGVQPFDCRVRNGDLAQWMPVALPSCLGNEFAGVVGKAGPGVEGIAPGDEVLGWQEMACYAETVVVDAAQVVAKPAAMPWETAGVLSASGQTAHTAVEQLGVGPGDTLLVHAAAGGVGSFAVQLAARRGARVVGTARPGNHAYLRSLGAVPIAYGDGLVERVREVAPDGVTVILDCVGGEALEVSAELLADRGRIGTIADRANGARLGVQVIGTDRSTDRLRDLVGLHRAGALSIHVFEAFSMADAPRAHRAVETGHVRGKVVLLN